MSWWKNLKFDDGIPIPPPRRRHSKIWEAVSRMKPGQSQFFRKHHQAVGLYSKLVDLGGEETSIMRRVDEEKNGQGWRVWRVK